MLVHKPTINRGHKVMFKMNTTSRLPFLISIGSLRCVKKILRSNEFFSVVVLIDIGVHR